MSQLLRFQLYADTTRQSYTQLHPDIVVEDPPKFGYGQPITVGPDSDDPATWPRYVVAHITHLKQEKDKDGKNRIVFEVFVAKEEEWEGFELPEGLKNGADIG